MRLYQYVGPPELRDAAKETGGTIITSGTDLAAWATDRDALPDQSVPATFVIDAAGRLRVADRRSEHVRCAAGGPVLSAGELFVEVDGDSVEVVAVTNQSTGYCPEPTSWPVVAGALDAAGIAHPAGFTTEYVF